METNNQQLNIAAPFSQWLSEPDVNEPLEFDQERAGYLEGIFNAAFHLLEGINVLSSLPGLSLRDSYERARREQNNHYPYLGYAMDLVDVILEVAEERTLEVPDIDSPQYDRTEFRVLQLEFAFDLLEETKNPATRDGDSARIATAAVDLAFELDEQIQSDQRDEDILRRSFENQRYADAMRDSENRGRSYREDVI